MQEDGAVLPGSLAELDGNGFELTGCIHIEQTERSRAVGAVSACQALHDLHVTEIHVASLKESIEIEMGI